MYNDYYDYRPISGKNADQGYSFCQYKVYADGKYCFT